jgi:hypothetical protein
VTCLNSVSSLSEVLVSLVVCGKTVLVPPVQKLPAKTKRSEQEVASGLQELANSCQGLLPAAPNQPSKSQKKKEQRMATKQLLVSWANAINSLAEEFDYQSIKPVMQLRPRRAEEVRKELTAEEKFCLGLPKNQNFFYLLHKPSAQEEELPATGSELRSESLESAAQAPQFKAVTWDSTPDVSQLSAYARLCLVADEGSEGWAAFGYLAKQGYAISFWRDISHKVSRLSMGAVARSPEMAMLYKNLSVVFKSSRGPFSTGKFGLALQEAHSELLRLWESNPNHEFFGLFICQVLNDASFDTTSLTMDLGSAAMEHFSENGRRHIHATNHSASRWWSWYDSAAALDGAWHSRLMCQAWRNFDAGRNPFQLTKASEHGCCQESAWWLNNN